MIGEALEENYSISELDLSWNSFGAKTAAAFEGGLRINAMLETLDMSNSGICDMDGGVLLHCFRQHGKAQLRI